jgi:cytidylate kinase
MCVPQRIVIAVQGPTCSGKTTTAKKLAALLGFKVRSAGDAVKARSVELNVEPDELSLLDHQRIDDLTRQMVESSKEPLIVEGTFLDALLSTIGDIYRIGLHCEENERRRRFIGREGYDGMQERDRADAALRFALHGEHAGSTDIVIDTTLKLPDEVAKEIAQWIQKKNTSYIPG